METNVNFEGELTMRKMLLVIMIGMVLAFDVYGIVKDVVSYFKVEEQTNDLDGVAIIVYVEE